LVGVILCTVAAITFAFFREKRFLLEVAAMEKAYYPDEYSDAAEIAERLSE